MIPIESMRYEQCLAELDAVLTQLENPETPLDDAVSLYERGRLLAQRCQTLLEQASLRVQTIGDDG
jgi:exodeoxyribonuclease VII small subunit